MKPSARLKDMCDFGYDYYKAEAGTMKLINRNHDDCDAIVTYAAGQESWHGDWWLWNEINCTNNMKMTIE